MALKKTDTATLADRLDVLSNALTEGKKGMDREFYMSIPARPGYDADLVLSESARRLRELFDYVERLIKLAAVQGIELRDLEPGGSPDMSYGEFRSLPDDLQARINQLAELEDFVNSCETGEQRPFCTCFKSEREAIEDGQGVLCVDCPDQYEHGPGPSSTACDDQEAWPRAHPHELAQFDPSTKVCTMNCGPHRDDTRSALERLYLCDDCETREKTEREA